MARPKKDKAPGDAAVSAGIQGGVRVASDPTASTIEEEAPIASPLAILAQRAGMKRESVAAGVDTLEEENGPAPTIDEFADEIAADYVQKVKPKNLIVLKKINRSAFRLGLEQTEEKFGLVPGGATIWEPDFKGDYCQTGLTDKPDVQKRLEEALGKDLSPTSEFWKTLRYRIEDKPHGQIMNFDDPVKGPREEAIYHAMLKSSIVANGYHEYSSGKKPDAEWFIENREAEAEAESSLIERSLRASETFKNASTGMLTMVAKLEGLNVYGLSPTAVRNTVYKWLVTSPLNAEKFLKHVEDTDMTRLIVGSLVKDALKFNIIRRTKTRDYIYGQEILGSTEDSVVSKLVLPTNQTLRIAIEEKVRVYLG